MSKMQCPRCECELEYRTEFKDIDEFVGEMDVRNVSFYCCANCKLVHCPDRSLSKGIKEFIDKRVSSALNKFSKAIGKDFHLAFIPEEEVLGFLRKFGYEKDIVQLEDIYYKTFPPDTKRWFLLRSVEAYAKTGTPGPIPYIDEEETESTKENQMTNALIKTAHDRDLIGSFEHIQGEGDKRTYHRSQCDPDEQSILDLCRLLEVEKVHVKTVCKGGQTTITHDVTPESALAYRRFVKETNLLNLDEPSDANIMKSFNILVSYTESSTKVH